MSKKTSKKRGAENRGEYENKTPAMPADDRAENQNCPTDEKNH